VRVSWSGAVVALVGVGGREFSPYAGKAEPSVSMLEKVEALGREKLGATGDVAPSGAVLDRLIGLGLCMLVCGSLTAVLSFFATLIFKCGDV